ncbi:DNA (cytosine-5-)-methyltransferase [Micromonospora sp. NPDC048830]|uniref:DNA (cytosine-5-)-methyltransferase n=1 Tax=Micromonospora sp. NPDC048830 TaxID=3364257 RepID=UPI00370FD690
MVEGEDWVSTRRSGTVVEEGGPDVFPQQDPQGTILRVAELLEVTYRSADLGNITDDVLSETLYILLSLQTQELVYQRMWSALRERFPTWVDAMKASREELEGVLRIGGLQHQRAIKLQNILRAVHVDNLSRGVGPAAGQDLTLEYLRELDAEEAERFLLSLPGVGTKSARCVESYALGLDRFAVDTHIQRIFNRLGIVRDTRAKFDHDAFERVVPPRLRRQLHINMIHHGRMVCSSKPQCGSCVLVSFCPPASRSSNSDAGRLTATPRTRQPVAIDLFGGAGGLGHGFTKAGYRIALAVERDRHAAQTYRANNPGVPVIEADVATLKASDIRRVCPDLGEPDVILAGPPCQGYSHAGLRQPEDGKNKLFEHVVRLAEELGARYIVLENVPGLRRVNGVGFEDRILRRLRRKFNAEVYELLAAHFGVPQNRRRLFFLARRKDLGAAPSAPTPTHRVPGAPAEANGQALLDTPRLEDVLRGPLELPAATDAEYKVLSDGSVLRNASTMKHSDKVVKKIEGIERGQGPISYRRLELDLARTLVAGHRALPVHPWLHRSISVREAARIQGFEDDYFFCGPRWEQPLQVANAVPPPVGHAVAVHLNEYIDADDQKANRQGCVEPPRLS